MEKKEKYSLLRLSTSEDSTTEHYGRCFLKLLPSKTRTHLRKALVFCATMILLGLSLPALAQVPPSSHVILVIEENTSFNTAVANMPWLVGKGNTNGFANNYTTNSGGSLLDYLWLSSGSCHTDDATCAPSTLPGNTNNFGCNGEACGGGQPGVITDDSIFNELEIATTPLTWKVYAESIPSIGYLDDGPYPYVRRHNPAVWYSTIFNDASNVVPFDQFVQDRVGCNLPNYSIVVPNLLNDAHDGSPADADAWLRDNIGPLLDQPCFGPGGDGLLIITFDNGDFDDPGQVYTALIGPNVIPGTVSNIPYMHQNLLRTICDALGIGNVPGTISCPGAAVNASAMTDFFP